ncbi:MAG: hypothetical protein DMF77_23040 [Acidobacteria bacterium]|nr:MAG: hypothetical protein DMF77_23040 [Acidobacteriota bacterium]
MTRLATSTAVALMALALALVTSPDAALLARHPAVAGVPASSARSSSSRCSTGARRAVWSGWARPRSRGWGC